MKKIKIKICNYNDKDEFSYGHFITTILKKYYDVDFSERPDYLFYNESTFDHLKYDCIKIFYTGENIHPNFNFCDYAISFDYTDFGDRHFRLPLYLVTQFYSKKDLDLAGDTDFNYNTIVTRQDLDSKKYFCSFVYSNYLADNIRKDFFDRLSLYKKVNAGGKYLNNIGKKILSKCEFEMKHKFSIAFENSSRIGYTTEKITNSFSAKTIPIYFGNPEIAKEFNEKRFINCHNYRNFDAVIEKIKEIDNNDNLYLEIINEPIVATGYSFKKTRDNFELFLKNIFDQTLKDAKRLKINPMRKKELVQNEIFLAKYVLIKGYQKKILAWLYRPFRKIKFLNKIKEQYFINRSKIY